MSKQDKTITPVEIRTGRMELFIIGKTPLVYNAMSTHGMRQLLLPPRKKTMAERATTLKHEPMVEYINSTYRRKAGEDGPTRLLLPSRMFKAAVADVAKRVPGASKAELQQLVWVENEYIDLYGVPQIFMSVVRSADINRTPDVRTRAIVPNWACKIAITHVLPQVSGDALCKLAAAAGVLNGVGDFRQQKGAGNFGQFEMTDGRDARFAAVLKNGRREAQDRALASPVAYDQETEEMISWFNEEVERTDRKPRSTRHQSQRPAVGGNGVQSTG